MFNTNEKRSSIKCSTYHALNPEYLCICQAESFESLQSFCDEHKILYMSAVKSAWDKLYKTYPISGGCWLIQNPALIKLQIAAGQKTIIRKPPLFLCSTAELNDATRRSGSATTKSSSRKKFAEVPEQQAYPDPLY